MPALFLHGNPDSADLWDGVIARLRPHHRCLAPDLPGFGRSIAPKDFDCSFENLARFVDGLVQAIGIGEPLNLVVHDYGGAFAVAWAATHPEKVRRLVVMDHPFFVSAYRWHLWARIWRTPLLGELSMLTMNRWTFVYSLRVGSPKLPDDYIRRAYANTTPDTKRMILRLYRAADPEEFRRWEPRMLEARVRIPTLALWGNDPYVRNLATKCATHSGTQAVG
jgi:pimeloyl-ACP methyl ester carboxylesterase